MTHAYLGIDPGLGGGIAALDEAGRVLLVEKMPTTPKALLDMLTGVAETWTTRAVLEKVGVTPQMGVVSAGTFMKGVGHLEMGLLAADILHVMVAPLRWQKVMGVLQERVPGVKRLPGSKDKNINKWAAAKLFPEQKVTHAVADALLLAEYCRRIFIGNERKDAEP